MSLLVKGGITSLSELIIDADKDWQAKGITNIKEIAASMAKGDLAVRGNTVLVKFAPSTIGLVLTSAGPGHMLTWQPGAALDFYLPVPIDLSHAEDIVPVDQSHNENAALASDHKEAYLDAPADMIKRLTPAIALADAEAVLAGPDQSIPVTVTPRSGLSILCDGFVEETAAAVQTDKTAQARDVAANDLNLNPMTPIVNDKIYIGSNYKFWQVQMMVGTIGVGNWTNQWYYWNGAWVPVVGEIDGANEWQYGPGFVTIAHTPQGGWIQHVIQAMNLYWLKCETTAFVNQTTGPLGSQVWVALET